MTEMKRRLFLKTTTAAALAALGGSAAVTLGAAESKRKFTLDLRPGSIGVKVDQREAIRLAHAYGFESVTPDPKALTKLSAAERDDLLGDLEAKQLVWGGSSLPCDFRGREETFAADLSELPRLAGGLKRAGVTRVSTWIRPNHKEQTYLANFRQHATRLRRVAQVLGDEGLRFGMEYVGPKTSWTAGRYPFIHTMAETQDLIAEIGRDNVGLVLDSWHWYTAEETVGDLLTLTNRDVVACDLNDAPAGIPVDQQMDNTRELPVASGVIDLKGFLGALVTIGYDGPIRAEPFNKVLNALENEEAVEATGVAMKKAFALLE